MEFFQMSLSRAFFDALIDCENWAKHLHFTLRVGFTLKKKKQTNKTKQNKNIETGFHVAQAGLELIMKPRMTSDSCPSCPHLSSAEITSDC